MKKCLLIFCCGLIILSCSYKKNDPAIGNNNEPSVAVDSSQNSFFPVTSFLQGQIKELDSLPVTILQISTIAGKADSSWIRKEKMTPQLFPFTADLIDKENLTGYFKEVRFNDQSTDAITFTYDPKISLPDSFKIRHWDVYVDPEKGTIRRVYIVKLLKNNEATFTQQLTWQTGKWAKIVNIANKADGSSTILNEIKWVWDLSE